MVKKAFLCGVQGVNLDGGGESKISGRQTNVR